MNNKWYSKFDRNYVRIGAYAGGTALATVIIGFLLYQSLPALSNMMTLFSAVLKPLVIGLVISYLLAPLINRAELRLSGGKTERKWARTAAVFLTLIVIIALIAVFLIFVSRTFVKQINFDSLMAFVQSIGADFDQLSAEFTSYLEKLNISLPNIGSSVTGVISSVASGASTFFFGLIFAIYFMIDGKRQLLDECGKYGVSGKNDCLGEGNDT